MHKLKGLFAPVPTFLKEDETIDLKSNIFVGKKILESSIDGLFLLGTTGEFAYFSMKEKYEYIDAFTENLNQVKPIVCCVSHWSQKKSIELTEYALKKGYKYISATIPLYFPISNENICQYYRALRKKIDEFDPSIPLIFYHIPVFSAVINVTHELIIELANNGVIQAVKNSTPDLNHCKEIIQNTSENFSFLTGTEALLFHGFRDGQINKKFDGGIFSGLGVMPFTYKALFDSVKSHNRDDFARLWPLIDEFTALFDHGLTYLPQITKCAMKFVGHDILETVRAPLGEISDEIRKQITLILHKVQSFWGTKKI